MPPRKKPVRKRQTGGKLKIKDIASIAKKADTFLKKTKALSKVATALSANPQFAKYATPAAVALKTAGYGRRKKGRGLNNAGGTLRLAGQGRTRKKKQLKR